MKSHMMLTLSIFIFSFAVLSECRGIHNILKEFGESERKRVCIDEHLGCYAETNPNKSTGAFDRFVAWAGEAIDSQWWRSTREHVGTEFRFWQPNKDTAEVMNNYNFHVHITKTSGYDKELKTYFIIHGYHGGNAPWALEMKDALLQRHPCHVFIVDWSEGDGLMYQTARENTWVVGAEVGRFIERIALLTGMKPRKVHVIGHSLGAHTAGLVGKWLKNRMGLRPGRITGLDPAGPDFDDVLPGERLDRSDAAFVDVIHTNWADSSLGGLGLFAAIGHFDFYPNGGEDQPGCPTAEEAELDIGKEILEYAVPVYNVGVILAGDDQTLGGAFEDLACSHGRAYEYFIESIKKNQQCQFIADQCASWDQFTADQCPEDQDRVEMGYNAWQYRDLVIRNDTRKFYLRTNADKPYCRMEE